ncbi:MAG: hypothetical protein HRU37_13965, partial [Roseibacillus sp.]|nr:hypothetical protein [Roseibacillus sp.]
DDQDEHLLANNLPGILVYYGETIQNTTAPEALSKIPEGYKNAMGGFFEPEKDRDYPVDVALASHMIDFLIDHEFDLAASNELPQERAMGHAFQFPLRRFAIDCSIVPVMLNTYNPPTQPRAARCHELGRQIREAVAAMPGDARVGVLASGGLTHFVINEAFDRRVLGARMADRLKLNLVKKAGIFKALSDRYGIPRTMCTHTCWNALRLLRWTAEVEPMRADYLRRYLLLALASGSLDRVYWGPLIGYPDGLIDDGTGEVQAVERVAFYARSPGGVEDFEVLPAFETYRALIAELVGAELTKVEVSPEGCAFAFRKPDASVVEYSWTNE